MISIDYTITLGNILEVASIVGGGLLVLIKLNNNVVSLKADVTGMQGEIKKIGDVLIGMARFDEKLRSVDMRLQTHDEAISELRHGEGFVRGNFGRSIDKEYK